jgi:hypothetical protein
MDRNSPLENAGEEEKKGKHGENTLDTTFVRHIFITNTSTMGMEQSAPLNAIRLKERHRKKTKNKAVV